MPNDIISRVQKLPHAKSVLITGGPGAGKTTLAASLLQPVEQDVCWQKSPSETMPHLDPVLGRGSVRMRAVLGDLKRKPGTLVLVENVSAIRLPKTPAGAVFEHVPGGDFNFCPATVVLDGLPTDYDALRAVLRCRDVQVIVCTPGEGQTAAARELESMFDVCLHVHVEPYTHVRKITATRTKLGPLGSDSYDLVEGRGFVLRGPT